MTVCRFDPSIVVSAVAVLLGSTACTQETPRRCGPGTEPEGDLCVPVTGGDDSEDAGPEVAGDAGDGRTKDATDGSSVDGDVASDDAGDATDGSADAADDAPESLVGLRWKGGSTAELAIVDGEFQLPVGAPFEAGIVGERPAGGLTRDLDGFDIDLVVRGEGDLTVRRRRGHWFTMFTAAPGIVEYRAEYELPEGAGTVSTNWRTLRVVSSEEYDFEFLARVEQWDELDAVRPDSTSDLGTRGRSYVKMLPRGGRARYVGLLLVRRTSVGEQGGDFSAIAIPPRWLEASLTGAADVDGERGRFRAADGVESVELSLSYAPPVASPSLSATTTVEVRESLPIQALQIRAVTERPGALPLYRDRVAVSSASSDALAAENLHRTRSSVSVSGGLMTLRPSGNVHRLFVVTHHAPNPDDSYGFTEPWSGESVDFHHDYHRGYRRYVSPESVAVESAGDADAVEFYDSKLRAERGGPGLETFVLSTSGMAVPVSFASRFDEEAAESASFAVSPDPVRFTSWDSCKTLDIELRAGDRRLDLNGLRSLGLNCRSTDSEGPPGYPAVTSCYYREGSWRLCSSVWGPNDSEKSRWSQSEGRLELGALGVSGSVPIDADVGGE